MEQNAYLIIEIFSKTFSGKHVEQDFRKAYQGPIQLIREFYTSPLGASRWNGIDKVLRLQMAEPRVSVFNSQRLNKYTTLITFPQFYSLRTNGICMFCDIPFFNRKMGLHSTRTSRRGEAAQVQKSVNRSKSVRARRLRNWSVPGDGFIYSED
jgi:hypothetical protein